MEKALRVPSRCAVIFLDELDALGQSRENMGTGEGEGCSRRVLAELLLHLNVIADRRYCTLEDFAESNTSEHFSSDDYSATESVDSQRSPRDHTARIIVAAATNRIADIDPALLRRFGIQLEVGLPTRKDRQKMITRLLADIPHTLNHEELGVLAYITVDWSGSSLADLTRTAVMRPIHECLRKAAVLRRRSEKLEQRGGDPSGQNDVPQSSDMAATKSLVEGVQNLRAVTIHDFRTAISTLTGSEISFTRSLELSSSKKRSRRLHYDSSSSSEGEE